MTNLPKISGYGQYESDNYGVNCLHVDLGALELWYSYDTVIAFRDINGMKISENCWGPTTGKHLNWINPDKSRRMDREQFESVLSDTLKFHGLVD